MMTEEQIKAYNRFIRAVENVKLVKTKTNLHKPYIPHRDYLDSIDVADLNHPLFIENSAWNEYKEASLAWWAVEPSFRNEERLRASRGDYEGSDNWDDPHQDLKDTYEVLKGE